MMNFLTLENFFSNFSFCVLFLAMTFYWVVIVFKFRSLKFGTFLMSLANVSLMMFLLIRWNESGHFPLSNLYESLMFLSWSFTTTHLILEIKNEQKFVSCITSPIALFTNAFATLSLPPEMQHSSPLVPALQSNWLMMHVTVMILSYSALICGSLLSIAFLILTFNTSFQNTSDQIYDQEKFNVKNENPNSPSIYNSDVTVLPITNTLVSETAKPIFSSLDTLSPEKIKLVTNLDNLSYRILGIGFPFLTIGILSGAVWANEAWGSYWSWDPKETWALLTWLVFAIYLHTRITKGWKGKKSAMIASLGFFTVWICFLGVNLIGQGLHSYGWIVS
jgi:cytochrome c-type biogenesis protein CcsB